MRFVNRALFLMVILGISTELIADVNCEEAPITEILVYGHKIVIKQSNRFRGLGYNDTAKNQDKKLSVVLAAKAIGSPVRLVYPDGYDCNVHDYGTDPIMVVVK